MNFDFKKFIPHAIAIVVFAVLTLVYFNPIFSGKAIKQGDVANFKGMSKEIFDYREAHHSDPLWTNSMFGGMPAYQISVLYPSNYVRPLTSILGLGIPHPAVIIFLCFLGFYFLLTTFKIDKFLSAVMAIGFGLSSYTIILIEAGHNPKGYAIAYMAPFLAGVLITLRGRMWLGAAIAAISLSLELSVNHLQITYYLAIATAIIVLGEFVKAILEKKLAYFVKASLMLLFAAALSIGPNLGNLLLTQEYTSYSTRGKSDLTDKSGNQTSGLDKDYATQWSYGIGETFTLMIPNFKGGSSATIGAENKKALDAVDSNYKEYISNMDQYWGDQPFTSGPVYLGAIICFLFLLGMLIVEDKIKWYILAAVMLSMMLSWGKNFMGLTSFFMDNVPGYNKFRAVSMILVIAQLLIPLLGAIALNEVVKNPDLLKTKRKQFYIALSGTAGLSLLFYAMPTMFQEFFKMNEYNDLTQQLIKANFPETDRALFLNGLESARIAIFKADAMRTFLFIATAGAVMYIYSLGKLNKNFMLGILGVLVLVDLWTVDKRFLNNENFVPKSQMDVPFEPTQADLDILKDNDPDFRVANFTVSIFNDASTSYFHKSIGGYHGAKMKRYQELFDAQISKNNMEVLNMLNTKYFIVNAPSGSQDPNAPKVPMAQRNPMACGNAWFVKEVKVVANADEELKSLDKFNAKQICFVDKNFESQIGNFKSIIDSSATINLTSYQPNELHYKSNSQSDQIAVFSEIYYAKGWKAFIDGKASDHFRCDYVLRGMKVPAGSHEITFKFEPDTYKNGETLAGISSILLYVFLAVGIFLDIKRRKEEVL